LVELLQAKNRGCAAILSAVKGRIENPNPRASELRRMADDNEEAEEPAVELGEGDPVEGAPLARVASRLHWPMQKSEIARKEGDATIRTPDGSRELDAVLDEIEVTYFEKQQEFIEAVREVVGTGPVPTASE
jgi:hypothetical protein